MCKISDYPELYIRANETLRLEGISPEIPGYELLKRAIVIYKVEGQIEKERFLKEVERGVVIPYNRDLSFEKRERINKVEQWMTEAAKSIGVNIPSMEYVRQLANQSS